MQDHESPRPPFVQTALPWVVCGAALLVYLLTLNHWVTFSSLPLVAKVTGWDPSPDTRDPLHFLVSYPVRLMPLAWRPLVMNLLAAGFASLTLALLVRSVALLPHDRTREQRQRERSEFSLLTIPAAWVPPLFAALVCGLQMSFWEHATTATGEMLDLLLFAYCARCLLEYRVSLRESWLFRLAFVFGVAVTDNWAMIGFFPLFLVSLVWIMGRTFLNGRLLVRLAGWGLLGLAFYLLLPAIQVIAKTSNAGFFQLVWSEVGVQKQLIAAFPKGRVILLSLTSLLPLLVMGTRWPSSFGDTSAAGSMLTNLMFRLVHAMFLVACAWVAFDPKFSPRSLGYGTPFLPLYYLGALSAGYFCGYFLLVFSDPGSKTKHRISPGLRALNRAVTLAVWLGVAGVAVGLALQNHPRVRVANSPALRDLARATLEVLPAGGAVVLSDYPYQLTLLQAELEQAPGKGEFVLVDTRALADPQYTRKLVQRFPTLFSAAAQHDIQRNQEPLDSLSMLRLLLDISNTRELYYLHPSFGPFFEKFYLQPKGITYRLVKYAEDAIVPPPLSGPEIQANETFWSQRQGGLTALVKPVQEQVFDAQVLGAIYSRALNFWGVDSQKAGQLEAAGRHFGLAQSLNPENVAAIVNLKFNQILRSGSTNRVEFTKSEEELLKRYRRGEDLLSSNGPLDEPDACYKIGQIFAQGGLSRQAALYFIRVVALDPANLPARFMLAQLYLSAPLPEKTLEIVREVRGLHARQPLAQADLVETIRLEGLAYYARGELAIADRILNEAHKQYPQADPVLDTLFYINFGAGSTPGLAPAERRRLLGRAIEAIDRQLQIDPNNVRALLNKGATAIEIGDYPKAITALDQVLQLQPDNPNGLRNRAIARMKSGQLDEAFHDYEALHKLMPDSYVVHYGLAEISYKRKDFTRALESYRIFLKNAPSNTAEYDQVKKRVQELTSGKDPR